MKKSYIIPKIDKMELEDVLNASDLDSMKNDVFDDNYGDEDNWMIAD